MNIICRLLLIVVMFSFSGTNLKGETSNMQTAVATTVDSLHHLLKCEIDEEYKFKSEFIDHRDKTVDWTLAFASIFVTIISVFAVFNYIQHQNELKSIQSLKEKVQEDFSNVIKETNNQINGFILKSEQIIEKYIDKAENDILYIRGKRDEADKISEDIKMKSYRTSEGPEMNVTNSSNTLDSLCKLADTNLFIPDRLDEARAIWNIIIKDFKLEKKDLAFAYYKMAEIEKRDKTDTDLSLKIFTLIDLAIQLDPENEYYYSKRAEVFQNHGEFDKAENDYSNAIKVSKADSAFLHYLNRGYMKRLQGNIDGAIKDYNIAIDLSPDFSELYKSRAKAYLMKKEYAKAFDDFLKAYQLAPFFVSTCMNAYELAILLVKQQEASYLKENCQDDKSTVADYLNLLYEIIFNGATELHLESIGEKLDTYNLEIEWSFDVSRDILSAINNETATLLMKEYEQLINEHNGRFKTI
jgi:tetratricopeptide (TPR) repeat protein